MILDTLPDLSRNGIPRWLDAAVAGVALAVLSPLFVVVATTVLLTSRGPVLFRQKRVGRFGHSFTMVKFRSMSDRNAGPQVTAKGDVRITVVGRVLRKSKLDELPELWNVFVGDMALVGPRPEVDRFVDMTDPVWNQILRCRPGITDPVAICLRNEEELIATDTGDHEVFYRQVIQPYKLRGYLSYLRERTFWKDVSVLCRSILALFMFESVDPARLTDSTRPSSSRR